MKFQQCCRTLASVSSLNQRCSPKESYFQSKIQFGSTIRWCKKNSIYKKGSARCQGAECTLLPLLLRDNLRKKWYTVWCHVRAFSEGPHFNPYIIISQMEASKVRCLVGYHPLSYYPFWSAWPRKEILSLSGVQWTERRKRRAYCTLIVIWFGVLLKTMPVNFPESRKLRMCWTVVNNPIFRVIP